jgi:hypothetical protein
LSNLQPIRQVTAVCRSPASAKRAVEALVNARFPDETISVVAREGAELREFPIDRRTAVPQGAATGAVGGAALGLILSAIPGGGILAAGPALTALQGMGAGTALGSLLGTLAGLGWWKVDVEIPADELQAGAYLVGVGAPLPRAPEAIDALRRAGAERVHCS